MSDVLTIGDIERLIDVARDLPHPIRPVRRTWVAIDRDGGPPQIRRYEGRKCTWRGTLGEAVEVATKHLLFDDALLAAAEMTRDLSDSNRYVESYYMLFMHPGVKRILPFLSAVAP